MEPLFCARLVVDLCGRGEKEYTYHQEDGTFHPDILLGGTIEASSQNLQRSISNFASKRTAVLDVKQKSIATISMHVLTLCCVATMVVVRSSDSICLKILGGAVEANALYCLMASRQIGGSAIDLIEQDHSKIFSRTICTCLSLSDDLHVEDAISKLFGLCHRRWTTTPPLLILRFNNRDALSLSSVKAIRYLQLNSTPRVHFPDRPSGEPPAGHQLDRTSTDALEDCRCGNFGSGLSTPYGAICDLQRLLHEFRSTSCCIVQLGTYLSCSTVESHVMMYKDL